jgi:tripeptide aminopeptidase
VTSPGVERCGTLVASVIARTREVANVPGPPLAEDDRRAVVRRWWEADGLDLIRTDAVGNLWARCRAGRPDHQPGAVVVCAHLDTVFGPDVAHGVTTEGTLLRGPGVGDDSVALAALGTLGELLPATRRPVWLLATVGEEGLGDLRGARAAVASPPEPLVAFVAVEGNHLDRVGTVAVGSARFDVAVRGPGGHAWEEASGPSAVHAAADLVGLLAVHAGADGAARRAVNVGSIAGGEAINVRARCCELTVDLRADDEEALMALVAAFHAACRDIEGRHRVTVTARGIGRRPAGRLDPGHPLAVAAAEGLVFAGRVPRYTAASTDANAALAAGVPAVTVGITEGAGEHTPQEWIAVPPIASGLAALAHLVGTIAGDSES